MEEDLPPFGVFSSPASEKTPSMVDYERQVAALNEWNTL
jgi:hypothetical protein